MSSKSWTGDVEESGGSWLGFGSWSWWRGVNNVPHNLCSDIQFSALNKKVQRTPMSSKSWSRVVEDSGGSCLEYRFPIMMGGVYNVLLNLSFKIQLSTLNKKVQRTPMSLMSWTGVVEDFGGSWLGFHSWSWLGGVYNVPNKLYSEIQLSTLSKKVKRTSMSWKSCSGDVEDSGGSLLGFWFLIMIGRGQ